MIDIKNLRENIDNIAKSLSRRGYELDKKRFQTLDEERKSLQINVENYQSSRKKLSEEFGKLKASGSDTSLLKTQIDEINLNLKKDNELLNSLIDSISSPKSSIR